MSYESPISITNQIVDKIRTDFDDKIVDSIQIQTGVNVDKQELIKALRYDREQYQKGYEDGKKDVVRHGYWKKIVGMAPPEYRGKHICSLCGQRALERNYREELSDFCSHCGARMDGERNE